MRKGAFLLKALRGRWTGAFLLALVAFALVLLAGDFALAQGTQTDDPLTSSLQSEVRKSIGGVVCAVSEVIKGPVARLVSLVIFIGAVLYYMTSDSRTAKALAVAAVVGLILFNTLPTWQQIFTGQPYAGQNGLCTNVRTTN